MRILLNTLYVTTPDAYLSQDGLNVVISVNQKEIFRIPVHNIEQIVTFGYIGASPGLMKLCADSGVALTFLSPQGRFISRSQGPTKGNVLLRKAQYQRSDNPDYTLHLCRLFIAAKFRITATSCVGLSATTAATQMWRGPPMSCRDAVGR